MSGGGIEDAIVVGAGPAGLAAALYLARYHRTPLVLHDGTSRALRIPLTHNAPGFPDGVAGPDLVARMQAHAESHGARFQTARVEAASREQSGFRLDGEGRTWRCRTLVLATGILLNELDLPREIHEAAIVAGVLRYCPICDGYEATGRRIGVIGCDANGAGEALFLRSYSSDVTLMPLHNSDLTDGQEAALQRAGVDVQHGALSRLAPQDDRMEVMLDDRDDPLTFDVVYPALGCAPRNELARQLDMSLTEHGCAPVEAVRGYGSGLFVAGDLVEGLDQISVAMGHGALAATCAHNWLRAQDGQAF